VVEPAHEIVVAQEIGAWRVVFTKPAGLEQGGPRTVQIVPREGASESGLAVGVSSRVLRRIDFQLAGEQWRERRKGRLQASRRDLARRRENLRTATEEGITERYLASLGRAYVGLVIKGGTDRHPGTG
jgi:hypothetical protein